MRMLLVPLGSHGDVHPFVGMGIALQQRGHDVTLITNEHFRLLVEKVGLTFVRHGDEALYQRAILDPRLWDRFRSFEIVADMVLSGVKSLYQTITDLHEPGRTVVVAGTLAWGALLAREKHQIPTVTVHLAPSVLPSVHEAPQMPAMNLPSSAPRFLRKLTLTLATWVIDRLGCSGLNRIRAELGLPPIRRLWYWWNSPDRVLGLWPTWFGPMQSDWPAQVRLTGFPLYDERGLAAQPPDLEAWLLTQTSVGRKPLVFTPGSAMVQGEKFFAAAVQACVRLNRPGILLTRFPQQLPGSLPTLVRHDAFIPLSQILPRAAGLVHHGGIGTCAQGLACGVPQLVTPFSHDQPDNLSRLKRLGVARGLSPRRLNARRLTAELEALLGNAHYATQARTWAQKLAEENALAKACEEIEAVGNRQGVGVFR